MEMPITKVFRESIIRDMMIWMPARIMKLTAKTRLAPMTGVGMMTKIAAALGRKARAMRMPPVA